LLCGNRKELASKIRRMRIKNTPHELCLTDGSNEQGVIVHYDKSQKVHVLQMSQNFGSQVQIIGKLDCEPRLEAGIINCKLFILAQAPAGVKHTHLEPGGCGSGFNRVSGSRSRRAKMTHKSRKKIRNFMFN
jgi:hypothetical protein